MGVRHLETVEQIFPSGIPELHLVRKLDDPAEWRPTDNLRNPELRFQKLTLIPGNPPTYSKVDLGDDYFTKLHLLEDSYKVGQHGWPSPITPTERVSEQLGIQAEEIIRAIFAGPADANTVKVSLGIKWEEPFLGQFREFLESRGIHVEDIVLVGGRKRIQQHGFLLSSTIGEIRETLAIQETGIRRHASIRE